MAKDTGQNQNMDFYFYSNEEPLKLLGEESEKRRLIHLTTLANSLKDALDSTGFKKWEIEVEGYLEASSGFLPGGKAGFKATLRLSNT